MTVRASQLMAGKPLGIDRFSGNREPCRQETLGLLGPESLITEQVSVLGHPYDLFRREVFPAMRAGDSRQQAVCFREFARFRHESSPNYEARVSTEKN